MGSTQHTPGPWVAKSFHVEGPSGGAVADVYRPHGDGAVTTAEYSAGRMANARLIAAAPDLLAALRALVDIYAKVGGPLAVDPHVAAARAAIARAEGRPA